MQKNIFEGEIKYRIIIPTSITFLILVTGTIGLFLLHKEVELRIELIIYYLIAFSTIIVPLLILFFWYYLDHIEKRLQKKRIEIDDSKEYIENILHSMTDPLFVLNPDTSFKTVNQTALDLLEYEESELKEKGIEIIIPSDLQKLLLENKYTIEVASIEGTRH